VVSFKPSGAFISTGMGFLKGKISERIQQRPPDATLEVLMPAIASLEDLRAAQKDLLETRENDDLSSVFI